jgi:hypothetical protein
MRGPLGRFFVAVLVLVVVGFVSRGAYKAIADRRDANVVRDLTLEMNERNARTAHGMELRLWRQGGEYVAVLANRSGGLLRVYPPVRSLTLFVALFDADGHPYEPAIALAPHSEKTGEEPAPVAPHGKTWEERIVIRQLEDEFQDFDRATYIVGRYRYVPRKRSPGRLRSPGSGQPIEAEVWSNPIRVR